MEEKPNPNDYEEQLNEQMVEAQQIVQESKDNGMLSKIRDNKALRAVITAAGVTVGGAGVLSAHDNYFDKLEERQAQVRERQLNYLQERTEFKRELAQEVGREPNKHEVVVAHSLSLNGDGDGLREFVRFMKHEEMSQEKTDGYVQGYVAAGKKLIIYPDAIE